MKLIKFMSIDTANTRGKMAFMDNLVGLYIYQNNAGGIEYQERYGSGNKKKRIQMQRPFWLWSFLIVRLT